MTELTRQQRKTFYKNLLKIVCADPRVGHGFCWFIEHAAKASGKEIQDLYGEHIFDCDFIQFELPELFRIKPKDKQPYDYWFPLTKEGWERRINKLHNIIQKM